MRFDVPTITRLGATLVWGAILILIPIATLLAIAGLFSRNRATYYRSRALVVVRFAAAMMILGALLVVL